IGRIVQHEVGVIAPSGEQAVFEAGTGDSFEVDRRDDLVGVDVAAAQWNADAGVGGELLHDDLPVRRASTRRGPTVPAGCRRNWSDPPRCPTPGPPPRTGCPVLPWPRPPAGKPGGYARP